LLLIFIGVTDALKIQETNLPSDYFPNPFSMGGSVWHNAKAVAHNSGVPYKVAADFAPNPYAMAGSDYHNSVAYEKATLGIEGKLPIDYVSI